MRASEPAQLITAQYRAKRGMVYELGHGEATLTVHITRRSDPSEPGEWHVEANSARASVHARAEAWASTAADALGEVGRAWAEDAAATGCPRVDWEAVARALRTVRAI